MNRTATIALAATLVAVFAYESVIGAAGSETALLPLGALRTRGWSAGDWWRVVTFSFLHLNALHLALNVAALSWLGGIVERRVGALRMLAVAACAAVASGVTGMLLGPFLPTTGVAVGASGVVFGVLGAGLVLLSQPGVARQERERRLRRILTICLVAGLAASLLPGVSLAGHVGGLLGGALLTMFVDLRRAHEPGRRRA